MVKGKITLGLGPVKGDASAASGSQVMRDEFVIGTSPAFESILETINTVASRQCSMIISGETGAGKEMVARRIHFCSDRAKEVFVPVDCTTLTGQLFESQLFGHVRGAFTGAVSDTLGFFRAADKGTIFLDEISEIPLDLQAKLLRVLQESTVTPVGSVKSHPINVRVLCATNRNLKQQVDENKFRADLFYRLNVVTVDVPPLRERPEDILCLAEYFLARQAELYNEPYRVLSDEVKKLLIDYHWPGNIRELANVMERAYVLTDTERITPASLPTEILVAAPMENGQARLPTLDEAQRKVIVQALNSTSGRKLAAAKILGLERRKLNRLLERYNISKPQGE
ncbi:MAG: sigma-54 dependent transcriptional regulator [Planctomycetes bacterium]|nr:sigma-54 dependent transcriptional regulator [Planctomycetota bacterium]MBU1518734.1 sigma-54 dependent transcriptional regulator [Planctomycetota bacterium]MBU2457613.1 sigma-54 dependent transcriptional regulator [Planctomycetota bacterium]MBU2596857.1 sigma-54 dependent transcriptional regulator [Planctomycetota bacterium]